MFHIATWAQLSYNFVVPNFNEEFQINKTLKIEPQSSLSGKTYLTSFT